MTDQVVFDEGVASVDAFWKPGTSKPPARHMDPRRYWHATGGTQIIGDHIIFANGDRLDGLHPLTSELQVSTYRVMERFLLARAHLELSTDLALAVQRVAGSVAVILDERQACDHLLARAIAAPAVSW